MGHFLAPSVALFVIPFPLLRPLCHSTFLFFVVGHLGESCILDKYSGREASWSVYSWKRAAFRSCRFQSPPL